MPFCTAVGSCSQLRSKDWRGVTFGPVDRKWTKMILGKDTLKRAT